MPAAYSAPRPARRASRIPNRDQVRDCVECRRTLDIDRYYLRAKADPYLVGEDAVVSLRRAGRRNGVVVTPEEEDAVRQAALAAPIPEGRILRVQPRCRRCTTARSHRRNLIHQLKRAGHKVTADADCLAVSADPLPPAAVLERCAKLGLVLQAGGAPALPALPVEALRVCYAGLLSPIRAGYLGVDRLGLLEAIPGLVDQTDHMLAARAQDVIDCALVRERLASADDAMLRLLERHRPRIRRETRAYVARSVRLGLLTPEEGEARIDEGILIGVQRWDPLHASCAGLNTVVNQWVRRQVEVRTRGEHWVGQRKDTETGYWSAPAASIVQDYRTEEGNFEVHGAAHTHGTKATSADNEATEIDRVRGLKADMASALGKLNDTDREIVERRLLYRETYVAIAADLGMTVGAVKEALATSRNFLRNHLAAYEQE